MNDQDKVLISAYFDGDLSTEEEEYVENLLKKDKTAINYLKSIKEVDSKVHNLFESSLQSEQAERVKVFIKKLRADEKITSFADYFEGVKKFFIPQAVLGYALSGLIFFNLGTNNIALNGEGSSSNDLIAQFSYEVPLTKSYFKLRSINKQDETNLHIEETLNQMLITKKGYAKITYGSEKIEIKIIENTINEDNLNCFNGIATSDSSVNEFIFCKSKEGSSLLFK